MLTPKKESKSLKVKVDSLASNGKGVARVDGKVYFIAAATPGDHLLIEITKDKKKFAEAQIVEVLEPGPQRRDSPCTVSSECGGCSWIEVAYSEQLRQKKKILFDAITRLAGISEPLDFEVIASPNEFRYRNRIQVHYIKDQVGFHATGSKKLVPISDCLIANEKLKAAFSEIRQRKSPTMQRCEIRLTGENRVEILKSEKELGFTQVNHQVNQLIRRFILESVRVSKSKKILDLYCGAGNLTDLIAERFSDAKITGVEKNSKSLDQAKARPNIDYLCDDALNYVQSNDLSSFDLVVLDPPRSGCDQNLLENIAQSGVKKILYMSCNPSTWARDFKALGANDPSWSLEKIQGFDMFPQTPHLELVSVISKP